MKLVEVKSQVELSDVLDEVKFEDVLDYYCEDQILEGLIEKSGNKVIFEYLTIPEILRGLADKIEEENLKRKAHEAGK